MAETEDIIAHQATPKEGPTSVGTDANILQNERDKEKMIDPRGEVEQGSTTVSTDIGIPTKNQEDTCTKRVAPKQGPGIPQNERDRKILLIQEEAEWNRDHCKY